MSDTATEAIPVHLYFALDRTGSMQKLRSDVIGGFNSFLADQKKKPGECVMTLIQFDEMEPFEVIHDAVPLTEVPDLDEETYVPRSSTPLLDAEGRLIVKAEQRATARRAAGEPAEAIIFATYTDGLENASQEWTIAALSEKKKAHEGEWAFIYLGVGHDAYGQSGRIGTMSVNTVSAPRSSQGTQVAYDGYVHEVDNVRSRAAAGMRTNSAETAAAQRAENDRRTAAAESVE